MTTNRLLRGTLVAAVAVVGASCDSPRILAPKESDIDAGLMYDPTALVPALYHWDAGRNIAVFVDKTAEPAGSDLESHVRDGIAAWTAVGRLGEITLHVVSDVRSADVIFHYVAAPRLVVSDVCDPTDIGAGGYTYFCFTETTPPRAGTFHFADGSPGHVKMDVAVSRGAAPDEAAFRSIVMHEMGHVLGIGAHSTVASDLMFGSPRADGPSDRDARTLRFVLSQRAVVRFQ